MGASGLVVVASTWHRRVREDMEVYRVDQVKTVDARVERRLRGLGVRLGEDKVARVEWFGVWASKPSVSVSEFGPQNLGFGS